MISTWTGHSCSARFSEYKPTSSDGIGIQVPYAVPMKTVIAGLQNLLGGLLGLVIAVLPTLLISWIFLPDDGPPGEGFAIMFFYLVSCCVCVPAYVGLMALHRKGQRSSRKLIACEIGLRLSMIVAGCFLCFMAIKLPTRVVTKSLFCLLPVLAIAWAANTNSWEKTEDKCTFH